MNEQTNQQTDFAKQWITKQMAIDALRVAYWDKNIQSAKNDPCIVDAMTDWAIRQIKELPSAQPEIIRCRDCKHYHYANRVPQEQMCTCEIDGNIWSPDSYCSFAERRHDG